MARSCAAESAKVTPGRADLLALAERARQCISDNAFRTTAGDIAVTVSVGLAAAAQIREIEKDCENLLRQADAALYVAKAKGRNRVEISPAVDPSPA